jgi:hypothetical protein
MYPFPVRSRVDRQLVTNTLSKQPAHNSRLHRKPVGFANAFQQSRHPKWQLHLTSALLLLSSFIALSGCGGLSFKGAGSLSGTPASTASDLKQISCGTQSLVGPQTKACSIDLNGKATTTVEVSLQSSNAALQVPAAISVQSGAQSATFNIVSSNVTHAVTVTISGTNHGHKKSTAITLYPPGPASLTQLSCGSQSVIGPITQSCSVSLSTAPTSSVVVKLQSSSSYLTVPPSVTVAAGSTTGNFRSSVSAVSSPLTATITASLGSVTVSDPIQLNSATGSNPATQHTVNLSWNPPGSLTDLAGFHVYRSPGGASIFQLLDSTTNQQSSYADTTVASGQTYDYEVTSVSLSGAESSPSNITRVSIP